MFFLLSLFLQHYQLLNINDKAYICKCVTDKFLNRKNNKEGIEVKKAV